MAFDPVSFQTKARRRKSDLQTQRLKAGLDTNLIHDRIQHIHHVFTAVRQEA